MCDVIAADVRRTLGSTGLGDTLQRHNGRGRMLMTCRGFDRHLPALQPIRDFSSKVSERLQPCSSTLGRTVAYAYL